MLLSLLRSVWRMSKVISSLPEIFPLLSKGSFQLLHVGMRLDLRHPEVGATSSSLADDALGHVVLALAHIVAELAGQLSPIHDTGNGQMAEVFNKLLRADDAELLGQDIEDHQLLGVINLVQTGKRVRPEELREDLEATEVKIPSVLLEHAFNLLGQPSLEDLDALPKMGVLLGKLLETRPRKHKLISSGAKAVPAYFTIPIPMQICAINLLEGDALARRAIPAAGYFGVVQHGLNLSGRFVSNQGQAVPFIGSDIFEVGDMAMR
jgi:hypothetical protein